MENTNQPDFGNGKICYLEIPSVNIDESAAFYHSIFGWKTRTDNQGNIAFDDGVGQVSGMWIKGREPSDEIGLLVYIMVDDVAKKLDAVITQGGRMVQPIGMDAPEVTARFSDPSGNILGLYSQPSFENGKICYVEIPSTDINSSSEFYHNVFDWEIRTRGDGRIAFTDTVGQVSGAWILGRKPATKIGLLLSIMVDDAAATLDLIITNGGKLVQPIGMDAPEITARFSDPAGNILNIYQHRG